MVYAELVTSIFFGLGQKLDDAISVRVHYTFRSIYISYNKTLKITFSRCPFQDPSSILARKSSLRFIIRHKWGLSSMPLVLVLIYSTFPTWMLLCIYLVQTRSIILPTFNTSSQRVSLKNRSVLDPKWFNCCKILSTNSIAKALSSPLNWTFITYFSSLICYFSVCSAV